MMVGMKKSTLIKGLVLDVLIICLQISTTSQAFGGPFKHLLEPQTQEEAKISDKEILKNSQISYRAEGGFTGVQSYGVILSCVNGKVSVMKSIYDPRLAGQQARTRDIGSMDKYDYLKLWDKIGREAIFKVKDCPLPTEEISEEFTVHFYAKAGKDLHQFQVYGIKRPEASRYFAIRQKIDDSIEMQSLWNVHSNLLVAVKAPHLTNNINLSATAE